MNPKCPFLIAIRCGDEASYTCSETDKWCLVEYGYPCDEYDKWLEDEFNKWKGEQNGKRIHQEV